MSGFQVSLPALDALSARIAIAGSDVRSALGGMALNVCVDAGDARLSAALDGFGQFWQSATAGAGQAIDGTASTVAAAAAAYGRVDGAVMVDPSLTAGFVDQTLSGNSAATSLLLGPLLPGGGG